MSFVVVNDILIVKNSANVQTVRTSKKITAYIHCPFFAGHSQEALCDAIYNNSAENWYDALLNWKKAKKSIDERCPYND